MDEEVNIFLNKIESILTNFLEEKEVDKEKLDQIENINKMLLKYEKTLGFKKSEAVIKFKLAKCLIKRIKNRN